MSAFWQVAILSSSKSGFGVMADSFKGSLGALVFLILIFIGVYLLYKYKIER
jgi:hypothetical protein